MRSAVGTRICTRSPAHSALATQGPRQRQSPGWPRHPGPALVMTTRGAWTLKDPKGSTRPGRPLVAGGGFVARGCGNTPRATAGPAGAEFYATYVLPPDSHAVREPVTGSLPTPRECE